MKDDISGAAPSTLTPEQARGRLVNRSDMVPERVAFIDCKMPGSDRKENYSLIGPGVTQSKEQKVALSEPHGFSLGVAAMPPGTTNNLHVHYTAEVFMIYKGTWLFRWGADGKDGEIIGRAGDIVSLPTWIFRGFSNVGEEDGWIFTALGGDETGGIIWHPSILKIAAEHGLYLTRDNMMVDTTKGDPKPADDELLEVIDDASIAEFRHYSVEEMTRRLVPAADRAWSGHALLDSALPGHGAQIAPVIGHGVTQDRDQATPIAEPHGLSIDWLRLPAGGKVGRHRLAETQALIVFSGSIEVVVDGPDGPIATKVEAQSLYSVPAGIWRDVRSSDGAEVVLMIAGDHRKRIEWSPEIVRGAAAMGLGIDHNGYVAKLALLPRSLRSAFGSA